MLSVWKEESGAGFDCLQQFLNPTGNPRQFSLVALYVRVVRLHNSSRFLHRGRSMYATTGCQGELSTSEDCSRLLKLFQVMNVEPSVLLVLCHELRDLTEVRIPRIRGFKSCLSLLLDGLLNREILPRHLTQLATEFLNIALRSVLLVLLFLHTLPQVLHFQRHLSCPIVQSPQDFCHLLNLTLQLLVLLLEPFHLLCTPLSVLILFLLCQLGLQSLLSWRRPNWSWLRAQCAAPKPNICMWLLEGETDSAIIFVQVCDQASESSKASTYFLMLERQPSSCA
mmetsp:Transcript_32057/g.70932  ORF Transcript_32057/g.70932 Transcript_32057/m.70932 type:complete len:282 (-) Transcript_32057:413-1258(-)